MKQLIFLLFLISLFESSHGQKFKYLDPNLEDSCTIIETIIDSLNHYEKLVYIDYRMFSELKNDLSNFYLNSDRQNEIKEIYERILIKEKITTKKINHSFPEKWIKIDRYKGNWILYDNIEHNERCLLNDSCLIRFNMDGAYPNLIQDFKVINNVFHFKFIGFTWNNSQPKNEFTLDIKVVDPDKMIYAWKTTWNGRIRYSLMIPGNRKRYFSIIGTLTTDMMGDEYEILDEIDFNEYKFN